MVVSVFYHNGEKTMIRNAENLSLSAINGAIFDFDGTLFDSMFIWDTIGEIYLCSLGIEPEERLGEKLKSCTLEETAVYFREAYGVNFTTAEIMKGINDKVEDYYMNKVLPKEGVREFLEELKEHGVKMCVATVTDKYLVKAALERCNLYGYFSEIFTCAEVGHGKTEPIIYREAMKHLGTAKNDTVVFEDSYFAASTAKADGFTVIGIYDRHERNQEGLKSASSFFMPDFEHTNDFFKFTNTL